MSTITYTTTFAPGSRRATVTADYCTYRGVSLDRAEVEGVRGGTSIAWRAAWARDHLIAPWHATRDEAARVAPGYTG